MKNFVRILTVVFSLCFIFGCDEDAAKNTNALQNISANQIYFFYQTSCSHCHHAAAYIAQKYPNLKMINVDVREQSGYDLLLKCVQKFRLNPNAIGTPLICMGDHYIMGWDDTDRVKFDSYVQKFK